MKNKIYRAGDIISVADHPETLCTVSWCDGDLVKVNEYPAPFWLYEVRRVEIDVDLLKKNGFCKPPFFPSMDICLYWHKFDGIRKYRIFLSRNFGEKHWYLRLFSPKGDVVDFECDYLDEIQTLVDVFGIPFEFKL